MSKKCPNLKCGHPVEDWDIICPECNLDLTALGFSQAVQVQNKQESNLEKSETCVPVLELVLGSESFLCEDGTILGRNGNLAKHLFEAIETVSREHLNICLKDNIWNISVGKHVRNSTTLNGQEMDREKPYPLKEGEHVLTMSRACKIILHVKVP